MLSLIKEVKVGTKIEGFQIRIWMKEYLDVGECYLGYCYTVVLNDLILVLN